MELRRVFGASICGREPSRLPMLVAESRRLELVPAGKTLMLLRMAGGRNPPKILDGLRWDAAYGGFRWWRLKHGEIQTGPETIEVLARLGFGAAAVKRQFSGSARARRLLVGRSVCAGICQWPGNVPEVAVKLDGEITPMAWLLIDREPNGRSDRLIWQFNDFGEAWLSELIPLTNRPADAAGLVALRAEFERIGFGLELADTVFAGRGGTS